MKNYYDLYKGEGPMMTKNVNLYVNPFRWRSIICASTQSVLLNESIERVIITAVKTMRKTISAEM
jgi:hypothetical protein